MRRPLLKRLAMMSRSVDLPAPDAPITATSDPVSKWHDTSLIAAGFWKQRRGDDKHRPSTSAIVDDNAGKMPSRFDAFHNTAAPDVEKCALPASSSSTAVCSWAGTRS